MFRHFRHDALNQIGSRARLAGMLAVCTLVTTMVMGPVASAGAKDAKDLPTGEEVLAMYVEATGGQKAYDKIDNRVTKATMELKGQGITLNITAYNARPALSYVIVESDVIGKIEQGVKDGVAWEMSLMGGAQIKDGAARQQELLDATFEGLVYWKDVYESAEYAGIDSVDARPCHKVVLTPKEGNAHTYFFDTETHLMVKAVFTIENDMGSIPIISYVTDYKEIDGILVSHAATITVLGQERVLTAESIEHNVDLPDDRFDLPADIQALVDAE